MALAIAPRRLPNRENERPPPSVKAAGITLPTPNALAAAALSPSCLGYVMPSHRSAEPGHRAVLNWLGLKPVLELDMRLGEGTGAALAFGIVDAACRMMSGMATFAEAGVATADTVASGAVEGGDASL